MRIIKHNRRGRVWYVVSYGFVRAVRVGQSSAIGNAQ